MFSEFSLSLRNIKKLVTKEETSKDGQHHIHVSDYTDKDKTLNTIINA